MEEPIVETRNGKVRGLIKKSIEGYEYCAFLGIPYAKPPIGNLRFKDPEPIDDWPGIKDAKKYGNQCAQYDLCRAFLGKEDCLYLNVYARSPNDVNKLKPVMVWFHGGGFMHGSSCDRDYGPDYLLKKDIILVTFNYRLGIFGFLNLEHEVAPGNQGIKDQIMVLRWVKANIIKFGGDPNNITAFGESSGSVAIQVIALSPLGKGLFHKVINQSGTLYNTWVVNKSPLDHVFKLCAFLRINEYESHKIFPALLRFDTQRILDAQEHVRRSTQKMHGIFPFSLGIDNKSSNPVLPTEPEIYLSPGIQLPYLFGHNDNEGLSYLMGLKSNDFEEINRNFDEMLNERAHDLLAHYKLTKKELRSMYFKDEKITIKNCGKLAAMLGDLNFVAPFHKFAKLLVEKNTYPTYFYRFSYDVEPSSTKMLIPGSLKGCCHADERDYLFYVSSRKQRGFEPLQPGTDSYRVMERIIELWTNFATYGTPTPNTSELLPVKWEPLNDGTKLNFMSIDKDLQMKTMTNIEESFLAHKAPTKVL